MQHEDDENVFEEDAQKPIAENAGSAKMPAARITSVRSFCVFIFIISLILYD